MCPTLGAFSASGKTDYPGELNPKDGMRGLRVSEVVQGRDQEQWVLLGLFTPAHIRLALPHLSLGLSGCNKDTGSLGTHSGGSALAATSDCHHRGACMCGTPVEELSCCLEHLWLGDCSRSEERGSKGPKSSKICDKSPSQTEVRQPWLPASW